jgi:glycosyltransferase involved in cell wall biosynthesis
VRFLGEVTDDDIVDLYAHALGVIYPPYDEDYGYVTIEAFLARKPVVTTVDAGGPNEFVVDGVNGWVCPAEPAALGDAIGRLHADRARAVAQGQAGYDRARTITWDGVIDRLVASANGA